MPHQNWQIHSGTRRTKLEKNESARLTLLTLWTTLASDPPGQKDLASKTLFTLQRERCSTKNILRRSVTNDQTPALKSSLLVKSNDLGGYCSGPIQRILGPLLRPNTLQSPSSMFGSVACDIPLLHKGGARSKGDWFERTLNVSLHILHVPAINSLAVTLPTIS
jgi:hypothetical protein